MKGGCHCGGIQLHFHKHVAQIFFCHCSMCRKIVGSTVNDFVGVALSKLVMTKDSTLAKYRSSNEATRSFCNNCGCSIGIQYDQEKHTFWLSRGGLLLIDGHGNNLLSEMKDFYFSLDFGNEMNDNYHQFLRARGATLKVGGGGGGGGGAENTSSSVTLFNFQKSRGVEAPPPPSSPFPSAGPVS